MDVANVGVHVFSERLEVFILVGYEQKTILSRISFVSGKVTNKKLLHRFSCNQVASYCYFDAEIIRLKNSRSETVMMMMMKRFYLLNMHLRYRLQ